MGISEGRVCPGNNGACVRFRALRALDKKVNVLLGGQYRLNPYGRDSRAHLGDWEH